MLLWSAEGVGPSWSRRGGETGASAEGNPVGAIEKTDQVESVRPELWVSVGFPLGFLFPLTSGARRRLTSALSQQPR